ncbi:MAG TPA: hypothetical protein VGC96_07255 [Candidatus Elarobacter sp.]|jgi:hypothetical protein
MDRRDDRQTIDTIKGDTHDTLDEVKERVQASGEKMKRAVEGDSMPLGERVASHVKEAGHHLEAGLDASKRDLRDGEV